MLFERNVVCFVSIFTQPCKFVVVFVYFVSFFSKRLHPLQRTRFEVKTCLARPTRVECFRVPLTVSSILTVRLNRAPSSVTCALRVTAYR